MRIFVTSLCVVGLTVAAAAQQKAETLPPPGYDAALAQKLGADDYGMKPYVLVILKTGPKTDAPPAERQKAFSGHMANIQRLAKENKLALAGPMMKNDKGYQGIFIFNVPTIKEAEELVATDPAVAGGFLSFEFFGWYGTAALPEVLPLHARIEKKSH